MHHMRRGRCVSYKGERVLVRRPRADERSEIFIFHETKRVPQYAIIIIRPTSADSGECGFVRLSCQWRDVAPPPRRRGVHQHIECREPWHFSVLSPNCPKAVQLSSAKQTRSDDKHSALRCLAVRRDQCEVPR